VDIDKKDGTPGVLRLSPRMHRTQFRKCLRFDSAVTADAFAPWRWCRCHRRCGQVLACRWVLAGM